MQAFVRWTGWSAGNSAGMYIQLLPYRLVPTRSSVCDWNFSQSRTYVLHHCLCLGYGLLRHICKTFHTLFYSSCRAQHFF